jgi:hypothetical protein
MEKFVCDSVCIFAKLSCALYDALNCLIHAFTDVEEAPWRMASGEETDVYLVLLYDW